MTPLLTALTYASFAYNKMEIDPREWSNEYLLTFLLMVAVVAWGGKKLKG